MIVNFLAFLFLVTFLSYLNARQDDSYVVGIAEFRPELLNMAIATRTEIHLQAYKELLRSEAAGVFKIL